MSLGTVGEAVGMGMETRSVRSYRAIGCRLCVAEGCATYGTAQEKLDMLGVDRRRSTVLRRLDGARTGGGELRDLERTC